MLQPWLYYAFIALHEMALIQTYADISRLKKWETLVLMFLWSLLLNLGLISLWGILKCAAVLTDKSWT